jgi:E3 ubiquitin-protein ligase RAD18
MADLDPLGISDSTDWLSTPVSGLATVESGLRCRVCRDFYKTPMLTSCLHTFCSVCIRRALANDGKCPACRAPEQEYKLRWIGALDDVVDAFVKVRSTVLSLAKAGNEEEAQSPKRKLEHEGTGDDTSGTPRKRLRSSARLLKARDDEAAVQTKPRHMEVVDDSDDEEYEEHRMLSPLDPAAYMTELLR